MIFSFLIYSGWLNRPYADRYLVTPMQCGFPVCMPATSSTSHEVSDVRADLRWNMPASDLEEVTC